MRRSALLLVLAAALSGCYTTKLYVGDAKPARGDVHKTWQNTFLWGMISPGEVNLSHMCGNAGVARVRTQIAGWGLLANWLTAGIWVPVQVRVVCAQADEK